MTTKKSETVIGSLLGGEFETLDDLKKEFVRRSAVLDFLALYQEARKDNLVERVKHVVHAKGFLEFKDQHVEAYITRLLGRCLRAHFPGHGVVEKERNSFKYRVNVRYDYPQFAQIIELMDLVTLAYPWNPVRYFHHYGLIRGNQQRMQRYQNNGQLYWRTRGLVDPAQVDAMFAAWNQYKARIDTLERIQLTSYRTGIHVHYGNPGFIGRNRWYRSYSNPSYFAYEAYIDLKEWMRLSHEFLENDRVFETYDILKEHDTDNDDEIEKMLIENEEREAEFLRERAREMARQRNRPDEEEIVELEPYMPAEVEEGTTGEALQNRLLAKLREKGLME